MNQTSENGKKPNSRPNFSLFAQFWAPKFFFDLPLPDVRHCCKYDCIQFHRKLKIQTQENGEKSHFGPDLGLFGPNSRVYTGRGGGRGGVAGVSPHHPKNWLVLPPPPPPHCFDPKMPILSFSCSFWPFFWATNLFL